MKNDKENVGEVRIFAGKEGHMGGASGNNTDYLNYKSADHVIDGQELVKKDVFNKAVEECWCTMRMMCVDRISTAGQSECKQGGLCGFKGCPEMAEMRIRLAVQSE